MASSKRNRYASGFNGRTDFYHRSLGKTFLDYEHEVILEVGDHQWTRAELAKKLGCCHLAAARRLSTNLKLHDITSVNKLHATHPDELMGMAGIGAIQMFVAMCVLDAVKFDVERWYGFNDDTVTVHTLKARQKKEARAKGPRLRKKQSTATA